MPAAEAAIAQRKLGLQIINDAIFGTRVKTGRARGGWQASIGEPPVGQRENDAEGNRTLAQATAIINSLVGRDAKGRFTAGGAQHFTVLWLGNNVEYTPFLEELDGMLSLAIQRAEASFK